MTNKLLVRSPIKLNLFLLVLGQRDDGYHDLQTLFRLLDFGDEMSFATADHGVLSLHSSGAEASTLPMDQNLILTAAKALRNAYGSPDLGAEITIIKNTPQGAGLGGGSSNAASTLLALNSLWDLQLKTKELSEIGRN